MHTWTVPGYSDVRELGRNGDGRTVLATHAATGAPVIIRYLARDLRQDEPNLGGYRARARVLTELESPHVADVYEYVESDHGIAIVREYVEGASVRQLMATSGLHPEAALSVLQTGLHGLAAAHASGATHGGYKPENLLVNRDGTTKLADFTVVASIAVASRTVEQTEADDVGADLTKDDISAALTTFLECLLGSRTAARADGRALDRVPKQLRSLATSAATDDGALVAADLDRSARATYGGNWESSARTRLAHLASRLRR